MSGVPSAACTLKPSRAGSGFASAVSILTAARGRQLEAARRTVEGRPNRIRRTQSDACKQDS
jgi:hypothetical protein